MLTSSLVCCWLAIFQVSKCKSWLSSTTNCNPSNRNTMRHLSCDCGFSIASGRTLLLCRRPTCLGGQWQIHSLGKNRMRPAMYCHHRLRTLTELGSSPPLITTTTTTTTTTTITYYSSATGPNRSFVEAGRGGRACEPKTCAFARPRAACA